MKLIALTIIGLVASAAAFAQAEPPKAFGVADVYLAKDDGNGKAGEQVHEFSTSDIPIYCIVQLDDARKVTVKMNFVAVGVPGIKPDTKVVTASYTTKEGQNRVNFSGRPEGIWPPGKYRVDIFLDGKAAKALEFEIRGPAQGIGGNNTAKKLLLVEEPKPRKTPKTPKP